jgi:hypothetical protein
VFAAPGFLYPSPFSLLNDFVPEHSKDKTARNALALRTVVVPGLLALAAAIVAATFAASVAVALLVAAVTAVDGLGFGSFGLRKSGGGEDEGE